MRQVLVIALVALALVVVPMIPLVVPDAQAICSPGAGGDTVINGFDVATGAFCGHRGGGGALYNGPMAKALLWTGVTGIFVSLFVHDLLYYGGNGLTTPNAHYVRYVDRVNASPTGPNIGQQQADQVAAYYKPYRDKDARLGEK